MLRIAERSPCSRSTCARAARAGRHRARSCGARGGSTTGPRSRSSERPSAPYRDRRPRTRTATALGEVAGARRLVALDPNVVQPGARTVTCSSAIGVERRRVDAIVGSASRGGEAFGHRARAAQTRCHRRDDRIGRGRCRRSRASARVVIAGRWRGVERDHVDERSSGSTHRAARSAASAATRSPRSSSPNSTITRRVPVDVIEPCGRLDQPGVDVRTVRGRDRREPARAGRRCGAPSMRASSASRLARERDDLDLRLRARAARTTDDRRLGLALGCRSASARHRSRTPCEDPPGPRESSLARLTSTRAKWPCSTSTRSPTYDDPRCSPNGCASLAVVALDRDPRPSASSIADLRRSGRATQPSALRGAGAATARSIDARHADRTDT